VKARAAGASRRFDGLQRGEQFAPLVDRHDRAPVAFTRERALVVLDAHDQPLSGCARHAEEAQVPDVQEIEHAGGHDRTAATRRVREPAQTQPIRGFRDGLRRSGHGVHESRSGAKFNQTIGGFL
jgi:hypothetical protein